MNQRLTQLTDWLKEKDISCSIVTSTPNVFYLSNFYTEPHERLLALFVFQDEEPILVCPAMEVAQAKHAGWEYEIIGFSDTDDPWELIQAKLNSRNLSPSKIALEKEHMTVDRYEKINKLFPRAAILSAEEKL